MLDITKIQHHTELMQRCIDNYRKAESECRKYAFLDTDVEYQYELLASVNKNFDSTQATLITQLKLTANEFNEITKGL